MLSRAGIGSKDRQTEEIFSHSSPCRAVASFLT